MKKRSVLGLFAILFALNLTGCDKDKQQVKELVTEDIAVFANGDMDSINGILFGEMEEEDEDGMVSYETDSGDGFLADLFTMAEVAVKKVQEDTVTLKITAPDMSSFFTAQADALALITTREEMRSLVVSYAHSSEKISAEVELAYTSVDGVIHVDYMDAGFIDAMTGGFVSAYGEVYRQMIEALGGGL